MNVLVQPSAAAVRRPRGPFRALADLFNSIWLGITLIALILLYGSLGSAIPGFRQMFELTEFQYFNHPIFFGLIVLFCINLTVATFRRIKFNLINAGVLTVHTGLLVLCFGSIVYFGKKIEGDLWLGAPVIKIYSVDRFRSDPDSAFVGQIAAVEGEVWEQNAPMLGGLHRLEVTEVSHDGLLTGARVSLKSQAGGGPEEAISLSLLGDSQARMAKFTERFVLMLSSSPEANYFYDDTTPALIVSHGPEGGRRAHIELPVLPYYHERFVEYEAGDPRGADLTPIKDSDGNVVRSNGLTPIPLVEHWRMPFSLIRPGTALAEDWPVSIEIDGYLPYAEMETIPLPGGQHLHPIALFDYSHGKDKHSEWLLADSPEHAATEFHDGPRVEFQWIGDATEVAPEFKRAIEGRHVLDVWVKDKNVRKTYDVSAGQVIPVEGTDYVLTVEELRPSWPLMTAGFQNARTPIALVIVKSPAQEFQRSVLQRFPELNQDRHPQSHPDANLRGKKVDATRDLVDDNIVLRYVDADSDHVLMLAGENLSPVAVHTAVGGKRTVHALKTGEPLTLPGGTLVLREYYDKPRFEKVPIVVPERNRRSLMDVRRGQSVIRLLLSGKGKRGEAWTKHVWVPFHSYNRDNYLDQAPATVVSDLPDVEPARFVYGRAMRALPATLTLERLQTDMYPGEEQAREWTSYFRYRMKDSDEVLRGKAYLNNTYTIGDWTFFQARASGDHTSWTVLGVGNRRGVWTMLIGCCLVSIGMAYAFAVKPALVRRRRMRIESAAALRGGY